MEQDPAEPLGTEAFLSLVFLSVGNRLQPPWPSLSSKGQIQTLLTKGGAAKKPSEARSKGVQSLKTPKLCQQPHSWTIAMKPLTKSSHLGMHSFSGQESAVAPFAWQSNKALIFYFTQSSVSKVLFTPVHKGQERFHHHQDTHRI